MYCLIIDTRQMTECSIIVRINKHCLRSNLTGMQQCIGLQNANLARPNDVQRSVVGPFLCPARRPATSYQTTCEIRHVPLTVFAATRKLFLFVVLLAYTSAHQRLCDYALYKSTVDIDVNTDWVKRDFYTFFSFCAGVVFLLVLSGVEGLPGHGGVGVWRRRSGGRGPGGGERRRPGWSGTSRRRDRAHGRALPTVGLRQDAARASVYKYQLSLIIDPRNKILL